MPGNLIPEEFTESHLAEVQDFDCGDERWEKDVSDWIKKPRGGGGALDDMSDTNSDRWCKVWLYRNTDGELVGFGSLGPSAWRWPKKKSDKTAFTVITWCAVQKKFWGQPDGPKSERYSHSAMDHLITEALKDSAERPLLGLMVHPENARAISFYRELGFVEAPDPYKDKEAGITYNKMFLILDQEAATKIAEGSKEKK